MGVVAPHTGATALILEPLTLPQHPFITLNYSITLYITRYSVIKGVYPFAFRLTCRPDLSRRRGRGPPHAARSPECGLANGAPRHGSVPKEEGEVEGYEEGEEEGE